jgi:hypothetical protein
MKITEEKLAETCKKFKEQYGGRKEDYFAPLFLAEEHGKNIEDVLSNCSFGSYDYGIDAYYIDKEAKNLYLYQFKWSEKYEGFKESFKRLIDEGIERIFGNPLANPKVSELILKLKRDVGKDKSLIESVYIRFVFNGDVEKARESSYLENLKEDLESKRHFLEQYFENDKINFIIEYLSNKNSKNIQVSSTKESHQYDISFKLQSEKPANKGKLYVGFISLFDLYEMNLDMKQGLFERNIRFGLDASLAPNQAIKNSLRDIIIKKKTSPEDFTFLHNGITISAEKLKIENGCAKIIEPRVLNGAQTITILSHFIEKELRKRHDWKECENTLKEIEVIGKIITSCSRDFVTQVTISNNKQNPVKAWNLRANDDIQLNFEDIFRKKSIYYERQENSFENFLEFDLEGLGIDKTQKPIKVTKLAQTFLAFQGDIGNISNLDNIFGKDDLYEKSFKKSYLEADIRKIIIAYKIQFRLGAIINRLNEKGPDKYYFIGKAKPLIWALAIQGLLNYDCCDDGFLNNYGSDLSFPQFFVDTIKDIGVKEIRSILSDLIEENIGCVNDGKFSFLSKKETFDTCMKIAKKKYRWIRQELVP